MAEFNYFNYNAVTSLSLSMQKKGFFLAPRVLGEVPQKPPNTKYLKPSLWCIPVFKHNLF